PGRGYLTLTARRTRAGPWMRNSRRS
ncbi:uncharacterized protein METZ01_LOCUS342397, partial [marine metagenome]